MSHFASRPHPTWGMPSPDSCAASEPDLVKAARAGSREAFDALVIRHQATVYRLALRLTGNEHDAGDVLQETFLQVFRKLSTFRGDAQFVTWLYRVATNAALMHRRSRRRHVAASLDAYLPHFDARGHHARMDVDHRAAARIEQAVERRQLQRLIRDAVAELAPRYRVPFALCDLEGLPAPAVARLLGLDAAAVRQRVHRARLLLRGYLAHLADRKPHE